MTHKINVPNNETIFYAHEIKTEYDDIIFTHNNNVGENSKCCVFRMPNKIIYHYIGWSNVSNNSKKLINYEIIHGKHLYLHYQIGNRTLIRILNMRSGITLFEKDYSGNSNGYSVMDIKYKQMEFIMLCYFDAQKDCVEIFDESFRSVHKYYSTNIMIKRQSQKELHGPSKNYTTLPLRRYRYYVNPNIVLNNHIVLFNNCHIRVLDFVNHKIMWEHIENKKVNFIRWKDNSIIYKVDNIVTIKEIIDKDMCTICFTRMNNDEKHAIISYDRQSCSQSCSRCLQYITTCFS